MAINEENEMIKQIMANHDADMAAIATMQCQQTT
jgi:hypothetical protein